MTTIQNTRNRHRKSISLTPAEKREYKKLLSNYPTLYDAALAIGISQVSLSTIKTRGTCHESSYIILKPMMMELSNSKHFAK